MIYTRLGDLEISKIGLGAMRFHASKNCPIDYRDSKFVVDYALDNGINYIDTGRFYCDGESEIFLGEVLKSRKRDSYILTDKLPVGMFDSGSIDESNIALTKSDIINIREETKALFYDQLHKCNTDYFDIYLFHGISRYAQINVIKQAGLIDLFEDLRKSGKLKYLGFSFHGSIEMLHDMISIFDWDVIQLQLNYLDWSLKNSKEQYEIVRKHNIPCITMESLKGGKLAVLDPNSANMLKSYNSNYSIPSWGIRYLNSLPGIVSILSGMNSISQVISNIESIDLPLLTDREFDLLYSAAKEYNKSNLNPCTRCNYCLNSCSNQIPIPDIFDLYYKKIAKSNFDFTNEEKEIIRRSKSCTRCGDCLCCPQKLMPYDIIENLKFLK